MTFDENTPKNAGDRAFGHGNTITLEYAGTEGVESGDWLSLGGDGTVVDADAGDTENDVDPEVVAKHSAEAGDKLGVHFAGIIRAKQNDDSPGEVIDGLASVDGEVIYRLR